MTIIPENRRRRGMHDNLLLAQFLHAAPPYSTNLYAVIPSEARNLPAIKSYH
jgi:hypothetical protein